MTTPTQMPESLKVVRDSLRTAAIEIAAANHYGWGNVCTDAADAIDALQSALKDRDAEIERLKKDAERWDFVRHHWSNVQMRWNNDETNSLKSITLTVKTAHWSCDADAIESQIDAAIDSMKGDAS